MFDVTKFDKKSSLIGGFKYDLLIIQQGLIFGPPCRNNHRRQLFQTGEWEDSEK